MNKPFPLPVRAIGPGSQAEDEELQYLAMPRDMATFAMPAFRGRPARCARRCARPARGLPRRVRALGSRERHVRPAARSHRRARGDARHRQRDAGRGRGVDPGRWREPHRIQESVFTGVWRVCAVDGDGRLASDAIEAAPVPGVALAIARAAGAERIAPVEIPPGQ